VRHSISFLHEWWLYLHKWALLFLVSSFLSLKFFFYITMFLYRQQSIPIKVQFDNVCHSIYIAAEHLYGVKLTSYLFTIPKNLTPRMMSGSL